MPPTPSTAALTPQPSRLQPRPLTPATPRTDHHGPAHRKQAPCSPTPRRPARRTGSRPTATELPNVRGLGGGTLPPMQDTPPEQEPRHGPAKPAPGLQARSRPRSGPSRRAAGRNALRRRIPPPMRRPEATKLAKEAPPSLAAPPSRRAEETVATRCDRPARPP
nr:proline-rich receptor-like protein kinase PERK2 [Lolium perenne]